MPVLDRSAEIGVTGARPRHGWPGIAGLRLRIGRHGVLPIRKVAIGDGERQRGAERVAMPNAACDHGPILLDLHPATPAVPQLAPAELHVDFFLSQPEAR